MTAHPRSTGADAPHPRDRSTAALVWLALLVVAAAAVFLTIGIRGDWSFALPLRARRLATLALVGTAISVSTVLFQTIGANRILTPSIMGFDALYGLIQTALVFLLGAHGLVALNPVLLFLAEVAAMVGLSLILYRGMFAGTLRSLHLLVLIGIVTGLLFRSLSGLLQRLIDPNAFVVLQDRLFASFTAADPHLLEIGALAMAPVLVAAWRMRDALDLIALGRETAIGLGLGYRRRILAVLAMIAVLVSVSTALVGPVAFFGLLVANLTYLILGSWRHARLLPGAALLGVLVLVAGQFVLERLFAFDTALSIVIEFLGGIAFLVLLLKGARR